MNVASDTIIIGKIGAPHGVQGWVKINSFTQNAEDIFAYSPWKLGNAQNGKTVQIDQWRHHGKALVAKVVGVESRDDAELIKNLDISISASQLPELENDFYWKDLIGMQVVTTSGYNLGKIREMFETGSNDVMMVKANPNDGFGQSERLLPFIYDQVVIEVDKASNTITVDWDPAF